jgi:hypothetical protein
MANQDTTSNRRSIDPLTVTSPKRSVAEISVVYDGGVGVEGDEWTGWCVVRLLWDGQPRVGIRWNGEIGKDGGMPNSHGWPTWFVVPQPLGEALVELVDRLADEEDAPRPSRLQLSIAQLIAAARTAKPEEIKQVFVAAPGQLAIEHQRK